jgi:hypothetical protein
MQREDFAMKKTNLASLAILIAGTNAGLATVTVAWDLVPGREPARIFGADFRNGDLVAAIHAQPSSDWMCN